MNPVQPLSGIVLALVALLVAGDPLFVVAEEAPTESKTAVDYTAEIKPLLKLRCAGCHGPLRQNGGLRLDAAVFLFKGGDSGPAVKPGRPDESLLMDALLGRNFATRMPLEGKPLTAKEIDLVRSWIAGGAHAPEDEEISEDPRNHWAFQPVRRPAVPRPQNAEQVRNPVDAFLAVEHEKRGLTQQPPAEKHILLRRVTLDLTGLPPTPEELRDFLADDSPRVWEKVVDRLLKSPRYGERWGRHWMDVWRYSDWYGYRKELRNSARHIWRWRDWIVESLNEDKPYDRMIVEMLAGDEVDPADAETVRATGFLARNYYKFNRNVWLDDTVEHTAKAFLGITMNCARCHSHMYDPITHREYYSFRAIFEPYRVRIDRVPGEADIDKNGLALAYDAEPDAKTFVFERGNDKHPLEDDPVDPGIPEILCPEGLSFEKVELPPEAYYPGLRPYIRREMLAAAEKKVAEAQSAVRATETGDAELVAVREKAARAAEAELASLKARIAADSARYADPPARNREELAMAASRAERLAALHAAEAQVAELKYDLSQVQQNVSAGEKEKQKTAQELKKMLAAAEKKIPAANEALESPDGTYKPLTETYPMTSTGQRLALANWIASPENPLTARVAVNQIWMRHFGKPLVSSVFDFGLNGQPPTHLELLDWLADEFIKSNWSMKHLHRLIVTSTAYRKSSSAEVHGQANAEADPDNRYLWRMNSRRMEAEVVRDSVLFVSGRLDLTRGGPELDADLGQTTFRRSLYYRHAPEKFMTFLELFDTASTHECYRRSQTIVPQQALALVNSPLAIEQARRLAALLNEQLGGEVNAESNTAFIDALFERVLCRRATDEERETCRAFLKDQTERLSETEALTTFAKQSELKVQASADPRLRARESLAHVLLNHNEFVTIR